MLRFFSVKFLVLFLVLKRWSIKVTTTRVQKTSQLHYSCGDFDSNDAVFFYPLQSFESFGSKKKKEDISSRCHFRQPNFEIASTTRLPFKAFVCEVVASNCRLWWLSDQGNPFDMCSTCDDSKDRFSLFLAPAFDLGHNERYDVKCSTLIYDFFRHPNFLFFFPSLSSSNRIVFAEKKMLIFPLSRETKNFAKRRTFSNKFRLRSYHQKNTSMRYPQEELIQIELMNIVFFFLVFCKNWFHILWVELIL